MPALLFVGLLHIGSAYAKQANHVTAEHAWIRLLPGDLPAAGYVTLQNNDAKAATIAAVQTNAYTSAMIHQSTQDADGMSHMAMVDHLAIPAHAAVSLSPSGYHLMLEHASHPVKPGDSVNVTLRFADGSELPVSFLVRPANAVDTN
ncbi:copper chaperone PCu(A)C [Dyella dinghuensis]|uniref:Copper chaperone PCu(A)C n=1 Tax=Dyella dinghuensis TaxID=1920169 RepID=A0A432LYG5_9GAMM|nr:copper chaperone PCu(A)C [Dyella dinghuensis]RUL66463.1 copper chaperone PCu(A)C [Dyella dinghuensis]